MKHNQFYQEARLSYPLYRPTEDICICLCIYTSFQRGAFVERSMPMQQHFEQFVGKQRRAELKSVGNFVVKIVLVENANHFSLEELCRT